MLGRRAFGHLGGMTTAPHSLTFRRLVRGAALTLAALAFATGATAGIKSKRLLAKIAEHTPAPVIVERGTEMALAEAAAAALGGTTLWGIGRSMEPLYAPETAVVVKEVSYDAIKKGMTVVYRKANGRLVAHSVIGEDARGYIVQGVNNDEADAVSVNEKNLVGVIAAAYSANDTEFRAELVRHASGAAKTVAMR